MAKEYIERVAALNWMYLLIEARYAWASDARGEIQGLNAAVCAIEDIPAADVVPVVHGRWIKDGDEGPVYCSECGEEHEWEDYRASYCDCCGARMDGDRDGTIN